MATSTFNYSLTCSTEMSLHIIIIHLSRPAYIKRSLLSLSNYCLRQWFEIHI